MAKQTPKPIRKTVSFKYRNFKCYEHIKDIDNFSEYVCRLIELDMMYDLLNRGKLEPPKMLIPEQEPVQETEPEQETEFFDTDDFLNF
jgi:hypothetical protein